MATIQEARQQINLARQRLQEQKTLAEQKRKELEAQKQKLPDTSSQQYLRNKAAGLKGREFRREVGRVEGQITSAQEEVTRYKQEVLQPYSKQIEEQEQQVAAAEAEQASYNEAVNYIQRKAQGKRGIPPEKGTRARQILDELLTKKEVQDAISQGSELRQAATAQGFKSTSEYLSVGSALLGDKFDALKPVRDEALKKLDISNLKDVSSFEKDWGVKFDNIKEMTTRLDRTDAKVISGQLSSAMETSETNIYANQLTGQRMSAATAPKGYRPVSSAELTLLPKGNEGLNNLNIKKEYGITGLSIGLPLRNDILVDSTPSIRNKFSSFLSDINQGSNQAKKEVYSRQLGGFVSAEEVYSGKGGTAVVRVPTASERYELEARQRFIESIPFFGETMKNNRILQENLQVQAKINKYWDAGELDKVKALGGNILYVSETNPETGEIVTSYTLANKNVNVGGYKVPIQELDTSESWLGGSLIRTQARATGIYFGIKARELAEKTKYEFKEDTKGVPMLQYGTIQTDPITGENIIFKEVIIPKGTTGYFISPKLAEGVGRELGEFGTPYLGAAFFAGDTYKSFEKSGYQPIKFAKENPALVLTLATLGALKVSSKVYSKYSQEAMLLSDKRLVAKVEQGGGRNVINVLPEEQIKRYKLEIINGKPQISIVKKGTDIEKEIYSSVDTPYMIKEIRDVGRFRKKLETFEGIGLKTNEGVVEVLKISDDLVKVTRVDKLGKGQIELIKSGKVIAKQKIKLQVFGELTSKSKTSKIIADTQTRGNRLSETTYIMDGKRARIVKDEFGNVVTDIYGRPVNLLERTKRTSANIKVVSTTRKDLAKGIIQTSREGYGYLDIVEVGQRKGKATLKTSKGYKEYAKKQEVRIEYGIDKDKDINVFSKFDDTTQTRKVVTPKTDRKFTQIEGEDFLNIYTNPRYNKNLGAKEKEILKKAKDQWKQGDEYAKIIEENIATQNLAEAKALNVVLKEKPRPSLEQDWIAGQVQARQRNNLPVNLQEIKQILGETNTKDVIPLAPSVKVAPPETLLKPRRLKEKTKDITLIETEAKSKDVSSVIPIKAKFTDTSQEIEVKQQELLKQTLPSKEEAVVKLTKVSSQSNKLKDILQNRQNVKLNQLQQQKQLQQLQQINLKQVLQNMKSSQQQTSKQPQPTKEIKRMKRIFTFDKKDLKQSSQLPKKDTSEYKVFTKQSGKDIEIGTFKSKEKAKETLLKQLKGTLRASGFIEESGRKLDVGELGILSPEYRRGKKESYRLVQRKTSRLGSRSETKEAQFFRKKSKSVFA